MFERFWAWYERHYLVAVGISVALFLLQVGHLVWLGGEVIWARLFGEPLFTFGPTGNILIALIDYTEIPALVSVSLIYINEIRKSWHARDMVLLLLLNSQWLHLFWITDEVVVANFTSHTLVAIPVWLAWVAIVIDYAEVPVMIDSVIKFFSALRKRA